MGTLALYSFKIILKSSCKQNGLCSKGRRTKDPAIVHYIAGKEYLLKLDIKDFFGTIKAKDVHNVFKDAFPEAEEELIVFLTNVCCLNGKLPQGAPSSPALSI